jgi:hypothetical protein
MLKPRGLALLALAVAAVFGFSTVAQATTLKSDLTIKLTPGGAGTSKKPKGQTLNYHVTVGTDDGTSPPTTATTTVSFGKGIRFNAGKFPSCSLDTLNSKGPSACPKGSKVGTGSATALVGGSPGEPAPTTTETLKVTAFNGPGGKKYELYLDGDSPAVIKQAIEGTLSTATGDFGYALTVEIPPNLQQPVPGVYAPLVDFSVKTGGTLTKTKTKRVKGKKRKIKTKINYIETIGCTGGSWKYMQDFHFANASDVLTTNGAPQSC